MLTSTFLHLPRAGPKFEREVWNRGIDNWWSFIEAKEVPGLSSRRKIAYDMELRRASEALESGDAAHFGKILPPNAAWRMWPHFRDEAVFLDIETTGYYGDVTVVGLYSEEGVRMFVRGKNLEKEALQKALDRHKMIVTFNGSSFDLPVLRRYFNMEFSLPHIDLRGVCSQIGLKGGLKAIEKTIGLRRPDEMEGMDGYEAVLLWERYTRTGEETYLSRLIDYNEQDIVNLKPLAEHAIPLLWKAVRGGKIAGRAD